jgi:hypothetical protein
VDVLHGPVVVLGPEVAVGAGVDELDPDADPVGPGLHAALEHVLGRELLSDRGDVLVGLAVAEKRGPRGDAEPADLVQLGEQLVMEPVSEVRLPNAGGGLKDRQPPMATTLTTTTPSATAAAICGTDTGAGAASSPSPLSVRRIPSGVRSKIQATTMATGKPRSTRPPTTRYTHSGSRSTGARRSTASRTTKPAAA